MELKSTGGFSLTELLVVIAIISITATIAVPQFTKMKNNANLKEAAREISGDIQLCRRMAVSENVHYRIVINTANNEYTIQKETSPSIWVNVSSTKNVGGEYADVKIVGDPTYGADKIVFQPRGTTNAGTLKIQHEKSLSKASIVTSLMGRVRVKYELK